MAEQTTPRFALPVLAVGMGLIVLDGTVVSVALPTIIHNLGLNVAQAEWVSSLYSVIFASLLLLFGKLGEMWGMKKMFIAGLSVFLAGSAWCALSASAGWLIAGRALQGVGAAAVLPSSLATTTTLFRGPKRAAAFGVWGATMAAAAALGPLIGGVVTKVWSWPWIFGINLPVGLIIIALATRLIPDIASQRGTRLDIAGALASVVAAGSLVFGLIEAPQLGWWKPVDDAPALFGLSLAPIAIAVGLVTLAVFWGWQRCLASRDRSPLLDTGLFSIGSFRWGNLAAFIVAAGEFALVFALPLYLASARSLDVMAAGGVIAAMAVGAFISGTLARHLAARFGALNVVILGLAIEVAGVAALALSIRSQAPLALIVAELAVYGTGLGLASAQLTSTVLAEVPARAAGQGSATQSSVRQLGTALGVATAGTMLASQLTSRIEAALDGVPQAQALAHAISDSAGTALPSVLSQLRDAGADALALSLEGAYLDTIGLIVGAAAVALAIALVSVLATKRAQSRAA